MNTIFKTMVPAALCLLFATSLQAAPITKTEYKLQKDNISQTHEVDKDRCKSLAGNKHDVCVAEANAKRDIAKAELEAAYKNSGKERLNAAKVRADAEFDVAKERCDEHKGDAKSLCVTQAEAAHDRSLADIKAGKVTLDARQDINKARKEAAEDKMDASYKAEMERCDSLGGDAKDSCQLRVKQQFHKD